MIATSPRITARVDSDTRELLSKAATLSGISSINSFVLNAAIEKAKSVIERENILKLSNHDANTLLNILDSEVISNPKLQEAFRNYGNRREL